MNVQSSEKAPRSPTRLDSVTSCRRRLRERHSWPSTWSAHAANGSGQGKLSCVLECGSSYFLNIALANQRSFSSPCKEDISLLPILNCDLNPVTLNAICKDESLSHGETTARGALKHGEEVLAVASTGNMIAQVSAVRHRRHLSMTIRQ